MSVETKTPEPGRIENMESRKHPTGTHVSAITVVFVACESPVRELPRLQSQRIKPTRAMFCWSGYIASRTLRRERVEIMRLIKTTRIIGVTSKNRPWTSYIGGKCVKLGTLYNLLHMLCYG